MELKRYNLYYGGKKMWSAGTAVRESSGFVFLSGTEGIDPETDKVVEGAYAQTRLALVKIKERLEELGTSLQNICHIWTYIVGKEFPDGITSDPICQERTRALREFWAEHCPEFIENPPAASLIGVSGLGRKGMVVEIVVIAAIP
ncbi:MAG: RidA family protein [Chloroflexota bacterium]